MRKTLHTPITRSTLTFKNSCDKVGLTDNQENTIAIKSFYDSTVI